MGWDVVVILRHCHLADFEGSFCLHFRDTNCTGALPFPCSTVTIVPCISISLALCFGFFNRALGLLGAVDGIEKTGRLASLLGTMASMICTSASLLGTVASMICTSASLLGTVASMICTSASLLGTVASLSFVCGISWCLIE